MLEKLQTLPVYIELQKKFDMMSSREQLLLKLMFVALLMVLAYAVMWRPAQAYMQSAEAQLQQAQELVALIHKNQSVLRSRSASSGSNTAALDSQQLVSSVTNMARQHQLTLKRFEPSGENKVKVWVDDVPFNNMIAWLTQLHESLGIRVELVTIEKQDTEGRVTARLTLSS